MVIRQVRTKNNTYSTVKYDSEGNILTPERRRELKKLSKKLPKKSHKKAKTSKWKRLDSQFDGFCCVCQNKIHIGSDILWNKVNKKTKHRQCAFNKSFNT